MRERGFGDPFYIIGRDELPIRDHGGGAGGLKEPLRAARGDADVDVLACAKARKAVAIMDEAAGRSAATVEGIETRGTAFLVLAAVKEGIIKTEAGQEIIDGMIEAGWYLAPDLYGKVIHKLESLGE